MLCIAWSFIRLEGTTVTEAGTSRSGVSVLVAVEERVARYPCTGPSERSASPCTLTSGRAWPGGAVDRQRVCRGALGEGVEHEWQREEVEEDRGPLDDEREFDAMPVAHPACREQSRGDQAEEAAAQDLDGVVRLARDRGGDEG